MLALYQKIIYGIHMEFTYKNSGESRIEKQEAQFDGISTKNLGLSPLGCAVGTGTWGHGSQIGTPPWVESEKALGHAGKKTMKCRHIQMADWLMICSVNVDPTFWGKHVFCAGKMWYFPGGLDARGDSSSSNFQQLWHMSSMI